MNSSILKDKVKEQQWKLTAKNLATADQNEVIDFVFMLEKQMRKTCLEIRGSRRKGEYHDPTLAALFELVLGNQRLILILLARILSK